MISYSDFRDPDAEVTPLYNPIFDCCLNVTNTCKKYRNTSNRLDDIGSPILCAIVCVLFIIINGFVSLWLMLILLGNLIFVRRLRKLQMQSLAQIYPAKDLASLPAQGSSFIV